MKAINTLALAAFMITLLGYFFTAGSKSAPAESGGDRTVTDMLPLKRQASPVIDKVVEAPKPLKAQVGPNPILEALNNNDACQVAALKTKNYNVDKNDMQALVQTIDPSPALAEFLSENGPQMAAAEPTKKFAHKSSRLFWALRLSGITSSNFAGLPEDLNGARKILLELEKQDSGNGALPFFRLQIEKKLNFESKILADTAQKIASASEFNTYQDEIAAEFTKASWQSPAHYRLFQQIGYYALPSLNYYESVSILKALEKSGDFDRAAMMNIATLMEEKALRSNALVESREYSGEEYEMGRLLGNQENTLPGIYKISADRATARDLKPLEFPYLPLANESTDTPCDSRAFDEYFYANRGRY
ncbi:MAG: hypothetical protein ACXVBE_09165 [Bdellovibrionota bacterium]